MAARGKVDWRNHTVRSNVLPHATVTIDNSISAIREPRLHEGAVVTPNGAAAERAAAPAKKRKRSGRRR